MGREPLYLRVARDLGSRIAEGELLPGDYLPSEPELQQRYRVSRTTVRSAIAYLVASGQLVIERGVGTRVAEQPQPRPSGLVSFSTAMRELGRVPGLGATSMALDETGERVLLRRVHTADGQPVSVSESWLPAELFAGIPLDTLTDQPSLYERLTSLAADVVEVRDSYGITSATDVEAAALDVPPGTPLLLIERISHAADGLLVETSRIVANPNRYRPVIITRSTP